MKRLLIIVVLSITLLFSCTKPLDNIVILNVKDKQSSVDTTFNALETTPTVSDNTTTVVTGNNTISSNTHLSDDRFLIINKSSHNAKYHCKHARYQDSKNIDIA